MDTPSAKLRNGGADEREKKMATQQGFYAKKLDITCGAQIGGIKVFLKLVVDEDGSVHGGGTFTHSGTEAGQVPLQISSGVVHHTGFGMDHVLVSLVGSYNVPFGPPPMLGHIHEQFNASLVLDSNWNGTGVIHYGPGGQSACRDAQVKALLGGQ